jgi:S-adenosylmethionine hydrolase
MRVLTLLTDFGETDYYVAAVKGVVLTLAPETQIVDISHQVVPGNLAEAAFLLSAAAPSFPAGTVHLAVVDPGVGSARRILVAETGSAFFVGPDNGVLTPILRDAAVTEVTRSEIFRTGPGQTFHGRDRFAPVAAALLRGELPASIGRRIEDPVLLPLRPVRQEADRITGHIVHVDRYGNLVTDIPVSWLPEGPVRVQRGAQSTSIRATHYGELRAGQPASLEGSLGTLELSMQGEHLASRWSAKAGDEVVVSWRTNPSV